MNLETVRIKKRRASEWKELPPPVFSPGGWSGRTWPLRTGDAHMPWARMEGGDTGSLLSLSPLHGAQGTGEG